MSSEESVTNQQINTLVCNGSIDPTFIFFQISHNVSKIRALSGATTIPIVNKSQFGTVRISIPPLPQQRRIATILTTLDEVIEATEKLVEKHQQIKAGLMHDLFTRGLWTRPELARGDHQGTPAEATAHEGQLRPTHEEAPGLYQHSPLGLIPKAWVVKTIRDVIEIERGFAFSSSDYQTTGVLNFRVSNVGLSNEDLRNTEYLPPLFWNTFPQQQLFGGEIVIVMVGATTGKIGRVPEELCPALLNQNLWHLRPKTGFDREFAWNVMPMIVASHMRLSQGSARDFLKQSDFNKTLTICPEPDEQKAITSALDSISNRIDREQQLNRKLRQQKQGLMHDLLTGRVRVDGLALPEN